MPQNSAPETNQYGVNDGDFEDGAPFWKTKSLSDMSQAEWESLCDGCAKCCLLKLEDEDTGDIYFTDVVCRLLDTAVCRCSDYHDRAKRVHDCIPLTPEKVRTLNWLPPTCAYRLLSEGRDLYWWHPLVSADPETVHLAGISVRNRVLCEDDVKEADLVDRMVDWPMAAAADGS